MGGRVQGEGAEVTREQGGGSMPRGKQAPRRDDLTPVNRTLLEQTAHIMGPASAAALALRDADQHPGEVHFYLSSQHSWVVEKRPVVESAHPPH